MTHSISTPSFVGGWPVRVVALIITSAIVTFGPPVLRAYPVDEWDHWRFIVALGVFVLWFIPTVFSFKGLYRRWMQFGQHIQRAVSFILFSACFFLVVPWFAFLSAVKRVLTKNKREGRGTFWVDCPKVEVDLPFLKRMG